MTHFVLWSSACLFLCTNNAYSWFEPPDLKLPFKIAWPTQGCSCCSSTDCKHVDPPASSNIPWPLLLNCYVGPKVKPNIYGEKWNKFTHQWPTYRTWSGITDTHAPSQLLECTTKELGDIILRAHPDFTSQPFAYALRLLKFLVVVPVALCLRSCHNSPRWSRSRQIIPHIHRSCLGKIRDLWVWHHFQ